MKLQCTVVMQLPVGYCGSSGGDGGGGGGGDDNSSSMLLKNKRERIVRR